MIKFQKQIVFSICLLLIFGAVIFLNACDRTEKGQSVAAGENAVDYYTCGMHPDVRVSPQEYAKGKENCPICNMKLTPVYQEKEKDVKENQEVYYGCHVEQEGSCPCCDSKEPGSECICAEHSFAMKGEKINCPVCDMPLKKLIKEEVDKIKGVVSRVKIKGEQIALAGVKAEPVRKLHLYKEIRTVGTVAYDPELAVAQEEYISAVNAWDKIKEGGIEEIKQRAKGLVNSSEKKLKLLGLNQEQIDDLKETKEIYSGLILPEETMWIYGDAYEYELYWIKEGIEVEVTAAGLPGEVFHGVIKSINPVLEEKTRTVKFRVAVENPGLKLKPKMYVDILIKSMYQGPQGEHMVLAIPKNAVLDTGTRRIVWVDKGNNEYEGRSVEIGPLAKTKIDDSEVEVFPVLKGLNQGELVVSKANFLIDSQSQLSGAAASAYGGALGADEKEVTPMPPGHQH